PTSAASTSSARRWARPPGRTRSARSRAAAGSSRAAPPASGPVGETLIPLVVWKQVHIIGSTMANRRKFNDVMRLFFAGRLKAILDEVVPLNGRRGGAGAAGRGQAVRQDRVHALAMRGGAVLAWGGVALG